MGKFSSLSIHDESKVFRIFDPLGLYKEEPLPSNGFNLRRRYEKIFEGVDVGVKQVLSDVDLDPEKLVSDSAFDMFITKIGGNLPVCGENGIFRLCDEVELYNAIPKTALEIVHDDLRVRVMFKLNQLASENGFRSIDMALTFIDAVLGFDLDNVSVNIHTNAEFFVENDSLIRFGVKRNSRDYILPEEYIFGAKPDMKIKSKETGQVEGVGIDLLTYYTDALGVKPFGEEKSWADQVKINIIGG